MVKDRKTRYTGIYQRVRPSGKVVFVARARLKDVGETSKSFRRLSDAREWYRKLICSAVIPLFSPWGSRFAGDRRFRRRRLVARSNW